jgi:hypothetical protein
LSASQTLDTHEAKNSAIIMTICLQDISLAGTNCLSYADRYPAKNAADEKVTERTPTKRQVTFSSDVSTIETEHLNGISPEEKAKRWLCGEDYFRTKIDLLDHLKIGKHFGWNSTNGQYYGGERSFINTNGEVAIITMRGIRSESESRQRRHDQQETTNVVLNEQLLQRSEGMTSAAYSSEVIAMLYHLMSFSNQKQALERGLYDALCVYGTNDNYRKLGTKYVLFENENLMESETMLVDEGVLRRVMDQGNCNGAVSVEDWLFERYQRGQRIASAYYDSDDQGDCSIEDDVTMVES